MTKLEFEAMREYGMSDVVQTSPLSVAESNVLHQDYLQKRNDVGTKIDRILSVITSRMKECCILPQSSMLSHCEREPCQQLHIPKARDKDRSTLRDQRLLITSRKASV